MEQKQIDPEDLVWLQEDLTMEELTSILFLLCGSENPEWILERVRSGSKTILRDFTTRHTNANWKTAFVQALAIVQVFEVIENLGIESSEARDMSRNSVINPGMTLLYQLCEACTKKPTMQLIQHIKNHCESARKSNAELLELHMLHLIENRLIKVSTSLDDCDFSFITSFFNENKQFNEVDAVLSKFPKRTNSLDNATNLNSFNTASSIVSSTSKASSVLSEYKACVLHVLVINQHTFKRDISPELRHFLPKDDLKERKGTAQDTEALQRLFLSFGYGVVVKNNLTHLEILREVEEATEKASRVDGLVVCILSHGHEGVVYGHNSIPVPIKTIKERMASKGLLGRPKIFLIQACQGESLQRSVRSLATTKLETDGPNQSIYSSGSVLADFLTFSSTIEGFASVRHIDNGSWFIQELVKKIRELHKSEHLMDICTAVIGEVSEKRGYRDECMLPKLDSTFTKNFRFPMRSSH